MYFSPEIFFIFMFIILNSIFISIAGHDPRSCVCCTHGRPHLCPVSWIQKGLTTRTWCPTGNSTPSPGEAPRCRAEGSRALSGCTRKCQPPCLKVGDSVQCMTSMRLIRTTSFHTHTHFLYSYTFLDT